MISAGRTFSWISLAMAIPSGSGELRGVFMSAPFVRIFFYLDVLAKCQAGRLHPVTSSEWGASPGPYGGFYAQAGAMLRSGLACRLLARNSEGPLRLSGAALPGPLPRVSSGLRLVRERMLTQDACWVDKGT